MHSYSFETQTEWKGGRQAETRGPQARDLQLSAPAEFRGQPGYRTPEFLLVAAAEVCLMETFIGMGEWSHLKIASYRSTARSKLEKMEKVRTSCLIANSLRAPVIVHAAFQVAQPA
jgi:organic hydroperoxide reductase OsmC/OhrA